MKPGTALRHLLAGDAIVVAPGVYDGLSARLAARAGFRAVYATGGGIARSLGYPGPRAARHERRWSSA